MTERSLRWFMTLGCVFAVAGGGSAATSSSTDSPQTVRSIIAARIESLQNLHVSYQQVSTYSPRGSTRPVQIGSGSLRLKSGTETSQRGFTFLAGKARYETAFPLEEQQKQKAGGVKPVSRELQAFSGDRHEVLSVRGGENVGVVEPLRDLPESHVEIALALRAPWIPGQWISADFLQKADLNVTEDGCATLRCRQPDGSVWELVFRRDLGYALTNYRWYHPPEGNVLGGEVAASNFREVAGILLPFSITFRMIRPSGEESRHDDLTIAEYIVNDPTNTPDRYHIQWPEGASVVDRRTGLTFLVGQGGKALTNEVMHELAVRDIEKTVIDVNAATQPTERISSQRTTPTKPWALPPADAGASVSVVARWPLLVGAIALGAVVAAGLIWWHLRSRPASPLSGPTQHTR